MANVHVAACQTGTWFTEFPLRTPKNAAQPHPQLAFQATASQQRTGHIGLGWEARLSNLPSLTHDYTEAERPIHFFSENMANRRTIIPWKTTKRLLNKAH